MQKCCASLTYILFSLKHRKWKNGILSIAQPLDCYWDSPQSGCVLAGDESCLRSQAKPAWRHKVAWLRVLFMANHRLSHETPCNHHWLWVSTISLSNSAGNVKVHNFNADQVQPLFPKIAFRPIGEP